MVIDTSAIIAILANEPEAPKLARAIQSDAIRLLSAANLLETAIVIEARYGAIGGEKLDELLQIAQVDIEPVTAETAAIARVTYRTYGKGVHPAGLNFGDCFAYALAKQTGQPLLFKGDDFAQTDVQAVL